MKSTWAATAKRPCPRELEAGTTHFLREVTWGAALQPEACRQEAGRPDWMPALRIPRPAPTRAVQTALGCGMPPAAPCCWRLE